VDPQPSGIGVYSRQLLQGLAASHPDTRFRFCFRPHRLVASFASPLPRNAARCLLQEPLGPRGMDLFHGLNQRLPLLRMSRSVATFHDLFVLTGEYSSPDFRTRFSAQARDAAQRADLVVAVSRFTGSQVVDLLGVESSRVRVVHHGVQPLSLPQVPRENMILHVGALQRRKNIARLVAAFESLPDDWILELAGSQGFDGQEILERVETSRCRQRIRVMGYVSPHIIAECYARASIFAFPSLDEGFGMPVLEAMAAGVPVLTSTRSALPEIAGDAALLVDPYDTEQIREGLTALIQNQALRSDLIARGYRRSKLFKWSEAVEKTWAVYEELLA
jgi:glycosyltransferase involved in cell wall biosynthesis